MSDSEGIDGYLQEVGPGIDELEQPHDGHSLADLARTQASFLEELEESRGIGPAGLERELEQGGCFWRKSLWNLTPTQGLEERILKALEH